VAETGIRAFWEVPAVLNALLLKGKFEGNKERERPRRTLMDDMLQKNNYHEVRRLTEDQ